MSDDKRYQLWLLPLNKFSEPIEERKQLVGNADVFMTLEQATNFKNAQMDYPGRIFFIREV